jgi:predicted metal-dependent phosphoesterase TrpH
MGWQGKTYLAGKRVKVKMMRNSTQVDLHIHTYYSSDGDYSPSEIARLASEKGLAIIAVADHDTIDGVALTQESCSSNGIEVIPAVEISTMYQGTDLHLLAYFIDLNCSELLFSLDAIRKWDLIRVARYVDTLVTKFGFDVRLDEVLALTPRGMPKLALIAKAILTNGRNENHPLLTPYRTGERADLPYHNFFLDYLRSDRPAYVPPVEHFSTVDAIDLTLACGGIPVLAHPGGNLKPDNRQMLLDDLVRCGLRGIEVYSSYHTPIEERWYQSYTVDRHLLVTAGSDFHGPSIKPGIEMGNLSYHEIEIVEKMKSTIPVMRNNM